MTAPDYVTLLIYVLGIFAISTVAARRTSSQQDMFSAGRRSPWWASGLSGFMTMFSAATFVVWGGIAYELGIVAVAINTCYGIAALLAGYFVAGRWNALGVATPAEYVQLRFGKVGLHFFTWTMLVKRILNVAVSVYALAVLLITLMPLDLNVAIILFGAIVVLYTMQGGLWAVLMTDVLQFIVLTVVVLLVAVLMLAETPSPSEFVERVPKHFLSLAAGNYGWLFLFGWVTIHFFMIGAEWAFVQRFLAVRNPAEARKSAYLFGVMYLLTPLFWLLPPLLYRGQVADVDKEQAYMLAAQSVLPAGMLGLMFAAMFSATASMVSSQLNVFAGVLTNDFYRALFNPGASERTLVRTGRVFTAILGALLVGFAMLVPWLGGAEKLIITTNQLLVVPLFAPTLWGLFSKKIGIRDMVLVTLTSFSVGLLLQFGVASNPWIEPGNALWNLKTFLSANSNNVEVFVGVVLPVLMLCGFQYWNRRDDPGAIRLEQQSSKVESQVAETEKKQPFDPFPAQTVMYSLFFLGAWMAGLGWSGNASRLILMLFAVVLIILAAVIQLRIHQKRTKDLA